MPVFAITGNPGCGKSTVCAMLAKRGALIFDADAYVHRLYQNRKSPVYKKVATVFPQTLTRGVIDRRALGAFVFNKPKARMRLEGIVHPPVIKALRAWCLKARSKKLIALAEVPLLFEKKLENIFDGVIVVRAPLKTLRERTKKRKGYSVRSARDRFSLYLPMATKIRQADFIIDNSASRARLYKEIDIAWKKIQTYTSREKNSLRSITKEVSYGCDH
ncbi:MAG: dephospho-CoA kinase [Candidatus Omnitrophota bacterium]|nr:dephospho-CoA kinase [Candidatus Omnitrophota bacterium]